MCLVVQRKQFTSQVSSINPADKVRTTLLFQVSARSGAVTDQGVYFVRLLGTRSIEVREQPDVLAALPSQATALIWICI
jgi:hypothetical protein